LITIYASPYFPNIGVSDLPTTYLYASLSFSAVSVQTAAVSPLPVVPGS